MGSLNRMIGLLKPMGLYNLTDSYVLCELKAEAAGLDRLEAAMEELLTEAFPATASDFGLSVYERILKLGGIPEETLDRRSRIVGALSLNEGDNTVSKIMEGLKLYGVIASVGEDFENELITVSGSGYSLGCASAEQIGASLLNILPAHLGVAFQLNIGTWYFWNNSGISFSTLKTNAYTFENLAAMGNISQSY